MIPELVSPAGDFECMRAAAANGANAIYFGLGDFNARRRATNFSLEELPGTIQWLHDRNVKGYVTFNTLIFPSELPAAAETLARIAEAGVDAVVVQDIGLLSLLRKLSPTLPVHASTQMTLSEPLAIRKIAEQGARRVILPRELSLAEIETIHNETSVELEVFVHGALCISYSGQCLASLSLGGRSGNRGMCAQPCRMAYQLVGKGVAQDESRPHPLSPHDLAAYELLPDLVKIGVSAFKIEGRLKSAHYVAAVTRFYREALDAALSGKAFRPNPERLSDLTQGFSRGFSTGWLKGRDDAALIEGTASSNRGTPVGEVVGHVPGGLLFKPYPDAPAIKPGDGLFFDPEGGRLYSIEVSSRKNVFELKFSFKEMDPSIIPTGAKVWRTDDPQFRRRMENTYSNDPIFRRSPLNLRISAVAGHPLKITLSDDAGNSVSAASESPLELARAHPITLESLREQFSRLGSTPFSLAIIEVEKLDPVMVPKSVLNDLRRKAVDDLLALRRQKAIHSIADRDALLHLRASPHERNVAGQPRLHLLLRSMNQALALIDRKIVLDGLIYLDIPDASAQADAVKLLRDAQLNAAAVTPRIMKPGELKSVDALLAASPAAILVRNLGSLLHVRAVAPELPCIADFSLNASNDLSVEALLGIGAGRVSASYDLDPKQILQMTEFVDPARLEISGQLHMPMFHTEYCLFKSMHSIGGECGETCKQISLGIKDRMEAVHTVLPDWSCRTTVYNAAVQTLCESVPSLIRHGVQNFRIEFLDEDHGRISGSIDIWQALLSGQIDGKTAWRRLKSTVKATVIRGTWQAE